MKNIRVIFLFLTLLAYICAEKVTAQIPTEHPCVIPPVIGYKDNPSCNYQFPSVNYNYYDSCYQKLLIMKEDYEKRCFRYWDEQKKQSNTIQPTIPPSNNAEEELKKRIKELEDKLNVTPTLIYTKPNHAPGISFEDPEDIRGIINRSFQPTPTGTLTPTPFSTPIPTPNTIQKIVSPVFSLLQNIIRFIFNRS